MAFYQLEKQQFVYASLDEIWEFISTPVNLNEITPDYMRFDIKSKNLPAKMYPGLIIYYKVKPVAGIPVLWVTEITHIDDKKFFIDEQRIGPFSFWHHQHLVKEMGNGVLMTDIISYSPPFGFLGKIANRIFIRKQLEGIFEYRKEALLKRFSGKDTTDDSIMRDKIAT